MSLRVARNSGIVGLETLVFDHIDHLLTYSPIYRKIECPLQRSKKRPTKEIAAVLPNVTLVFMGLV